jgi:hypothetical protein
MLALVVAGCGGTDPTQRWLGTWSFASGDDNVSCPNGARSTKLTGSITVKLASGGGLVVLDAAGCDFTYAFDGEQARATGMSCTFPVPELGAGVIAAATYDAITLTTSDGKSMRDSFSGRVAYTASTGTLDCVFSGSATLSKVSDQ